MKPAMNRRQFLGFTALAPLMLTAPGGESKRRRVVSHFDCGGGRGQAPLCESTLRAATRQWSLSP